MKKLMLLVLLAGLVLAPNIVQAAAGTTSRPAEFDEKSYKAPVAATWTFDAVKTPIGTTAAVTAIQAQQKYITDLIFAYKKSQVSCGAGAIEAHRQEARAEAAENALKAIVDQLKTSADAVAAAAVAPAPAV